MLGRKNTQNTKRNREKLFKFLRSGANLKIPFNFTIFLKS